MSLMAGLVFGGLSAYGALNVSNDPSNIKISLCEYGSGHRNWPTAGNIPSVASQWSCTLFAVASGLLAVVMGVRYKNSGKVMPAGMLCGLRSELILHIATHMKAVIEQGSSVCGFKCALIFKT